jgi:hypothetical protein
MLMRWLSATAFGAGIFFTTQGASAEPLPRLNPIVLCMPSTAEENGDFKRAPGHFCILTLDPWFDGTSLELTPHAVLSAKHLMKRVGAELALRF